MTQVIKNLSSGERFKQAAFKAVILSLAALAVFYVYFLGTAVSQTMEGEKMLKKISEMEQQKIETEKKYIELINRFDLEFAKEKGFVEQEAEMAFADNRDFFANR